MEDARFALDDFELYQRARAFRKHVYELIRRWPQEERYCLGSQMRRAAISITNNIAEGHGRWHYQENIHFCRMAPGSTEETIDDLNTCLDESYATSDVLANLKAEAYELIRRIKGYIAYLRKTKQGVPDSA